MDKKELLDKELAKVILPHLIEFRDKGIISNFIKDIKAVASAYYEAEKRQIFEEIESHGATEKLPYRDGGDTIRIMPEETYKALKSKYLGAK